MSRIKKLMVVIIVDKNNSEIVYTIEQIKKQDEFIEKTFMDEYRDNWYTKRYVFKRYLNKDIMIPVYVYNDLDDKDLEKTQAYLDKMLVEWNIVKDTQNV